VIEWHFHVISVTLLNYLFSEDSLAF